MKKRVLSFLVCAAIMTTLCGCGDKATSGASRPAQPDNERVNPIEEPKPIWEYYESDDGSIVLEAYNGKDAVAEIPAEIDGKPVSRIGFFFSINNNVTTTLKIPASVEDISIINSGEFLTDYIIEEGHEKYYSVDGCIYQKPYTEWFPTTVLYKCPQGKRGEIVVADGTDYIESDAFHGCKGITAVKLPESVKAVNVGAFMDCTSLTSVNIPENTLIAACAFQGCASLESLDIPETADISAHAFDDTPFLQKLIEQDPYVVINGTLVDGTTIKGEAAIPDSVQKIAYKAFAPYDGINTELKKVTLPQGFTKVDAGAFMGCAALEEAVLPEGLNRIDTAAFENCGSLKSIVLPCSLTVIGIDAFMGCTSLTDVDIPNGVTEIGWRAFQDCENLERVNVPESIIYLGLGDYFKGCEKINVTFKGKTYAVADIDEFYAAVEENVLSQWE